MDRLLVASVVMPTHGRRASLLRVLQALAEQSVSPSSFEVIVVCDGDIDGSVAACHEVTCSLPYQLTVLEQENQGPAAARNRAIAAASAQLIIFIDDDVVPAHDLIAAHLAAQAGHTSRVTIGPLLPPKDFSLNPWGAWEERTLVRQYEAMSAGKWSATYRQFYTGNASVLKRHIVEAGGFDPKYRRAEDVELALRLRERGLHFFFVPDARGWHYVSRTYSSWLGMSSAYGVADLMMARAGWTEVLELVPHDFQHRNILVRLVTWLCVGRPIAAGLVTTLLGILLKVTAGTRSAGLGHLFCSIIFNLRYYDGLAAALGGRSVFMRFLRGQAVDRVLGPSIRSIDQTM